MTPIPTTVDTAPVMVQPIDMLFCDLAVLKSPLAPAELACMTMIIIIIAYTVHVRASLANVQCSVCVHSDHAHNCTMYVSHLGGRISQLVPNLLQIYLCYCTIMTGDTCTCNSRLQCTYVTIPNSLLGNVNTTHVNVSRIVQLNATCHNNEMQ